MVRPALLPFTDTKYGQLAERSYFASLADIISRVNLFQGPHRRNSSHLSSLWFSAGLASPTACL